MTTCPNRFLENGTIFRWVGETLLDTKDPLVVGEIGFLDRLIPAEQVTDNDNRDFIGRINKASVTDESLIG